MALLPAKFRKKSFKFSKLMKRYKLEMIHWKSTKLWRSEFRPIFAPSFQLKYIKPKLHIKADIARSLMMTETSVLLNIIGWRKNWRKKKEKKERKKADIARSLFSANFGWETMKLHQFEWRGRSHGSIKIQTRDIVWEHQTQTSPELFHFSCEDCGRQKLEKRENLVGLPIVTLGFCCSVKWSISLSRTKKGRLKVALCGEIIEALDFVGK